MEDLNQTEEISRISKEADDRLSDLSQENLSVFHQVFKTYEGNPNFLGNPLLKETFRLSLVDLFCEADRAGKTLEFVQDKSVQPLRNPTAER